MGRSPIRKHWLFLCRLVLLASDIAGMVSYGLLISSSIKTGVFGNWFEREMATATVIFVRFALSFVNDLFLITYGFYRTNTVIGTFFFQQLVYHPIIITLFTAVAYRIQIDQQDYYKDIYGSSWRLDSLFVQSWQLIPLTVRAGCDILMFFTLWCFLCGTKELRARKLSCLGINIDELAAGLRATPNRAITWRGVPRQRSGSLLQARVLASTWTFMCNSLFRRIVPVETKLQVFTQHIFSLGAIALLILRIVSALRNSYEDLPSRTIVRPCVPDGQYYNDESSYSTTSIATIDNQSRVSVIFIPPSPGVVYMRLPGHRRIPRTTPLSELIDNPYTVNVSRVYECLDHSTAIEPCSLAWVHTEPDKNDLVDWYGVFSRRGADDTVSCMQEVTYTGPRRHEGYEYRIERRLDDATAQRAINGTYGIHPWFKDESPSFWLGGEIMAPRISAPIQPEYGSYMSFKTQVTQRRFIVSSPLWDSITGSNPTYSTLIYFSPSIIRREPLQVNDSGVTVQATGLIYMPTYLETSEHAGRVGAKSGEDGPLCEITEDYRTTSTFDIFASIGGLLALLQGIHILLFGRPLFWGMFGTKLITPFGLAGRLATKGFKERLQERYYSPSQPQCQATQWQQITHGPRTAPDMNITQFLLDFVVDMGPASAPSPNREEFNTESSDSEDDSQYKPVQHLEDVEKMGDIAQLEWNSVCECPSNGH